MSIVRCECGERHVVCVGCMRKRDQNGYFLCLRHTDSPKSCFENIAQVDQHAPSRSFHQRAETLPFILYSTSSVCVLPQPTTYCFIVCMYVGDGFIECTYICTYVCVSPL